MSFKVTSCKESDNSINLSSNCVKNGADFLKTE